MQINEAYIVSTVRTPVGKAKRGALKDVRPEHLGAVAVNGAIDRVKGLDPSRIDDVVLGCAFPEGPQGMNMARAIVQKAGLPDSVPGVTVNRFCSSGVQTIAQAFNSVMLGQADCIVAGGVESMSAVPMGGFYFAPDPELAFDKPGHYASMGITAENVAARYGITREQQDALAVASHIPRRAPRGGLPRPPLPQLLPRTPRHRHQRDPLRRDGGVARVGELSKRRLHHRRVGCAARRRAPCHAPHG